MVVDGLVGRFAALELAGQECNREAAVRFGRRIDAANVQQVFSARDRILQRPVRFIDARRRLQRDALLGVAGRGMPVRMHVALQRAIRVLERRRVDPITQRKAEQLEVVA